jgi:hypothetical protein
MLTGWVKNEGPAETIGAATCGAPGAGEGAGAGAGEGTETVNRNDPAVRPATAQLSGQMPA